MGWGSMTGRGFGCAGVDTFRYARVLDVDLAGFARGFSRFYYDPYTSMSDKEYLESERNP